MPCPCCETPMEWDALIRAWFCGTCGKLYRLAQVACCTGYAQADRWMVGAEDGDRDP